MSPDSNHIVDISDVGSRGEVEIPEDLPILPLDNMVVFPFMIAPVIVGDESSRKMVEDAVRGNRVVGVFTRRDGAESSNQDFDELYNVGTAAVVLKMLRIPDGSMRLLLHGVCRVKIEERLQTDPYLLARVSAHEDTTEMEKSINAMVASIRPMVSEVVDRSQIPDDFNTAVDNLHEPGKLADLVASNINIKLSEQQTILEAFDISERMRRLMEILNQQLEMMRLGDRIQQDVQQNVDKSQREFYLREQLKAIRRELGESEGANAEIDDLRLRLDEKELPDYARETAERELGRLENIPPASPEYTVSRTYLDWILDLPWMEASDDSIDIDEAQTILDEDHYDLEKVKERILEHLAVIQLRGELKGPILCLVGPPGVGKTSLGRSVARAMGRKFVRIALGGVRDEAEVRGHRRTYIGSMPGRILKGLKDCKTNNPVMLLDEIDKLSSDYRGDPSSALLEALDPAQNDTFTDNYLDMPFDLSNVLFMTTANVLDTIPGPLRDRMEVLELSGYTTQEKIAIAKEYLIPRQLEQTGLKKSHLKFNDRGLETIIEHYTREAGLRNLERSIGKVARKVARKRAGGHRRAISVSPNNIVEYLGARKFHIEAADRANTPGVAIGLAWTPFGGEILFIEVVASKGKGQLKLTGKLGDVMKESAMAAVSYLKTIKAQGADLNEFLSTNDLHIHVPAGAIPKDGPSAGLALCTAVASRAMGVAVVPKLAMTGEITLTGKALAVGGIKEKAMGAHRAGIETLILPRRNEADIDDIPGEVRDELEIHFVSNFKQVARLALPNEEI